jgi:signal transduction histidine kinase
MTRPRSLAGRLAVYLLAAQVLGFFLTIVATQLFRSSEVPLDWEDRWNELAEPHARALTISSVARAADDALYIEPSPALRDYSLRVPTFRYAVFNLTSHTMLDGSAKVLAAIAGFEKRFEINAQSFSMEDESGKMLTGFFTVARTRYGPVYVATVGYRFHWDDLFYFVYDIGTGDFSYYVPGFVAAAAVGWLVLRKGVQPLERIAREAGKIDLNSLNQHLSLAHVPMEIAPLVSSMNEALARLGEEAERQRRFVANAAHELRTPTAILRARLGHSDEPRFLHNLEQDAIRIQNIVEQLMAAARIGAHGQETDQELNLVEIAQCVVDNRAFLAVKNRRELEFQTDKNPIFVRGDRRALESVLGNLIDNALRSEPEGGVVVVRVAEGALIEVVDHGEGVSENDRDKIFERFWRKSDRTSGAGLGLAIAKELIDEHDGRIWVVATPGGGATFKLLIPQIMSM